VNLIRVLKATVKAQARLPAPGLSTASTTKDIRRQRATTPIFTQERAPPQGGTKAYQLNAGNRCAAGRSRRSRSTVGAKGVRSIRALVCVYFGFLRTIQGWPS